MPRRLTPIDETPAWDIYRELLRFVQAKRAIPNEHALYQYVLMPRGYKMTIGEYRYYFGRLQKEGFVRVEPQTRAIEVTRLMITIPEEDFPEISFASV